MLCFANGLYKLLSHHLNMDSCMLFFLKTVNHWLLRLCIASCILFFLYKAMFLTINVYQASANMDGLSSKVSSFAEDPHASNASTGQLVNPVTPESDVNILSTEPTILRVIEIISYFF